MTAQNTPAKSEKPVMTAADAVKLAQSAVQKGGADFSETDERGFTIVNDKTKLVGKGFTIVETAYDIKETRDGGIDLVRVYAVLDNGKAVVFSDSSSGVFKQIGAYTGEFPVRIRKGLRVSEYQTPGREYGTSRTFYLDYEL